MMDRREPPVQRCAIALSMHPKGILCIFSAEASTNKPFVIVKPGCTLVASAFGLA